MSGKMEWDAPALLQLGRKFSESRIFISAVELGVFSALSSQSLTAEDITEKLSTDLRAMTMLLDALAAMGLLIKEQQHYRIVPSAAACLIPDSEDSILPMLYHNINMWERWSHLTEIVRTGKPFFTPVPSDVNDERYRSFILAMHVVGKSNADQYIRPIDLASTTRLLDIGGASGTYTLAFLRRKPELKVTLFDLPRVIPLARERLTQEGVLDRVTLHEGDFYQDDLPGGHDLALLSAIIHQNSREQNRDLYRKVHQALIPGGRIIIRDHVMDESRTKPVPGALFAINMLVGTEGGGTFTFAEIQEDLEATGFHGVTLLQPDEMMNGLVEAVRK